MKSERLELFKDLAYELFSYNRLSGTEGIRKTRKGILTFLRDQSVDYRTERFSFDCSIPEECSIVVEGERIGCVPYLGSKSLEVEAYVKRDYLQGDLALVPDATKEDLLRARERGVLGVITFREKDRLNSHIFGNYTGVDIPVVSIKREQAQKIEDTRVKLTLRSSMRNIEGVNIYTELGRGPVIYLVAHLDTPDRIYGAIGNGVSFLVLLFLFDELRRSYNVPYRLRFLITDSRELGMRGAEFHLRQNQKHVFYCINLEGIGWYNPSVLYCDADGYNGTRINDMFYKHVQEMRVNIDFFKSSERDGDHLPFKARGIETLFLTSHPFTIRHTLYDNYDAISWDHVVMWYEVILSFLRRFHKL